MKTTLIAPLALSLLAIASAPALAQSTDAPWSGFYVGGQLGGSHPSDESGGRLQFDTGLDGSYGDVVRTGTGADAFSPGFCGGSTGARTPDGGCKDDKGGAEYGARAGYDWQAGNWVYGVLLEYTKNDARDSVTGFSTTPASYTFTRDLDETVALRARIGYAFGENQDFLAYVTAGGARAKIDHSFTTTNAANSFTGLGDDEADGYQAGLGLERKVGENFSVGLEYLYTRLKDDDYNVRVGPGTAPATNPFLLVNPNGTDMRRSDDEFATNALRLTATYRF